MQVIQCPCSNIFFVEIGCICSVIKFPAVILKIMPVHFRGNGLQYLAGGFTCTRNFFFYFLNLCCFSIFSGGSTKV